MTPPDDKAEWTICRVHPSAHPGNGWCVECHGDVNLIQVVPKSALDTARALGRSESSSYAAGYAKGERDLRERYLDVLGATQPTNPHASAAIVGIIIKLRNLPLTAPPPAAEETKKGNDDGSASR